MAKIEVNAYYRKDGTFVKGHFREGFVRTVDLCPPDKFMRDYYPQKP
jgi:hypothetical protein